MSQGLSLSLSLASMRPNVFSGTEIWSVTLKVQSSVPNPGDQAVKLVGVIIDLFSWL